VSQADPASDSLDPEDWASFRAAAHRALDGMIDHIASLRDRPLWTAAPDEARARFRAPLPRAGRSLDAALADFDRYVKPYVTGNGHPGFMGWVHGAGAPVGMVAEMLAAGLNANCGGRNHIGLEVERQIALWMAEALGFPATSAGLFVTGASMANFLAVLVARNHRLGDDVRRTGLPAKTRLVAYASRAAHGCVTQAMQLAGLGADALRLVACDANGAMRVDELERLWGADRSAGLAPFLVVGTAGSVDIGAIDPLARLADFCAERGLWLHVDAAFGAMLAFSAKLRGRLAGVERADSIAFDFHKWAHVPYDAGFLLTRDAEAQRRTFAAERGYLTRARSGLAAGDVWPCDLGPDLSRGFRALKTWFTLTTLGTDRLGAAIERNCALAARLAAHIGRSRQFELSAPVSLNIVCFTLTGGDRDARNRALVEALHGGGRWAPSITRLDGVATIRCAIVNHRTRAADIDAFAEDIESLAAPAT
jgi:glutamate/tyrosine decarboxylase-like PLP-dependent enzyme